MKTGKKTAETVQQQDKKFVQYLYLIIIITFISFIPSLFNGFTTWDDDIYVTKNPRIQELSWKNLAHIFTSSHNDAYKPLTEFTFALEYHFFRLNPFIYHLDNLIFHIINSLLVFWFVFLVTKAKRYDVAFLAALIWAIHPLRVESAAWITERKDVLYTLFFMISLITYILYITKKNVYFYFISILSFLLSLMPKSQGLFLPFVLILCDYYFDKKINIKSLIKKIPYFIISIIFFIILYTGHKKAGKIDSLIDLTLFKNILYANFGLIFYLIKFILPIRLSASYPYPDGLWGLHIQLLYYSASFIVIILIVLIYFSGKYNKKIIFAGLFYFINLLIILQLKQTGTSIVTDRYTYVPFIALSFLAADAFFIIYDKFKNELIKLNDFNLSVKILLISIPVLILFIFFLLTWQRCLVWKNDYTLWHDAVVKHPKSFVAHINFAGSNLKKNDNFETAIKHYNLAIEYKTKYYTPYNALGGIYRELGQIDKAIEYFKMGIDKFPNEAHLYYNLALTYHLINKLDEAEINYEKTLKIKDNYLDACQNLNKILENKKK